MPRYYQVPIGMELDTIDRLDELSEGDDAQFDSRSAAVRHYVKEGLKQGQGLSP